MELVLETHAEVSVITVKDARIVAATAIQFKDQMLKFIATGAERFVLNLHQVDFIDSSGLGAIVASMKQLGNGQVLELAALSPTVAKVFRLTRMDTVFTIHDNMDGLVDAG